MQQPPAGVIPSLSALHDVKKSKEQNKAVLYDAVLTRCVDKIVATNTHTDRTSTVFEVPSLIIGHPAFDSRACADYIARKLSGRGYRVDRVRDTLLCIDWGAASSSRTARGPCRVEAKLRADLRVRSPRALREQTRDLLRRYPGAAKVVFVQSETPPKPAATAATKAPAQPARTRPARPKAGKKNKARQE